MKTLYLVRGVPGSGKTTFANTICEYVASADDFFTDDNGNYNWNPKQVWIAHQWCQKKTRTIMETGEDVAVANTTTTKKEMKPYYDLAEEFGYKVFSIVVENRHGGTNVHNVPEDIIEKMTKRFDIKL